MSSEPPSSTPPAAPDSGPGTRSPGLLGRAPRRLPPAVRPPGPPAWRTTDFARAAAIALAVWVAMQFVWTANALLFVVFLGVLFGVSVAAGVDVLAARGMRRGIASALIVFGSVGAVGSALALAAPTLVEQGGELRRTLPAAVDKVEAWLADRPSGFWRAVFDATAGPTDSTVTPRADAVAGDTTVSAGPEPAHSMRARLTSRIGQQLAGATRYLFSVVSSTLAVVGALVMIAFLAIYIGAEPDVYRGWLLAVFPAHARPRTRIVLTEIAQVLRKWLVTQLIAMLVIGTVSTIAFLLLGVKAAYALGFLAGLFEFIPTAGPILSAIPAIAMGFVDSPEKALWVLIACWAIQFLENNLLIPALMRGEMDLPPAITLVAQAIMTLLFGFLGLMVAVPLTAAVLVPLRLLYVEDAYGQREIESVPIAGTTGEHAALVES
ncbi:MAG: AI-2E family transporter [Gemmatimonadaceae bacterium]|nr:AI-2E family transporter [Gemmatimonadaceae bacterium]